MRKYLHDYEGILKRELERINESEKLSKKNKKLILNYYSFNFSRGISIPRIQRIISGLRIVAEKIGKDFTKVTKKDYENLFSEMRLNKSAPATIETYAIILKTFHKWINGGEEFPKCVKWFKLKNSYSSKKLPEQLLNQNDIKKLLNHARNPRNKALISMLWESGARIGEIGGLQLKNVDFDKYGCKILVDGKTGMRKIRLINSAPDILNWINNHPFKENPEAPLWINLHHNPGTQMIHRNIMKVLKSIAKKAGITKPVNPHHFRHSRATYMAQHLTEAQMKEYFGWVQDSKMAARYVHLSGKQVDNAILRMHGLIEEDKQEDILKRKPCPRCQTLNDINNKYCEKCWLPLTQEAIKETELNTEKEQTGIIAIMKLFNQYKDNPEQLQKTLQMIQLTGGLK